MALMIDGVAVVTGAGKQPPVLERVYPQNSVLTTQQGAALARNVP